MKWWDPVVEAEGIYRKLQISLDKMPVGFPATESGVEIRLLKYLYTPEEAEFVSHLTILGESFNRLYKRMKKKGMSKTDVETTLKILDEKGAIFQITKGKKTYFSKPQFIVGIYELQIGRLTKEFYELFAQYEEEILYTEMVRFKNQVRTIPVEKSLTPEYNISTYDDVRYLLAHYDGPIGLADCICRLGTDLVGNNCKLTKVKDVCISFREAAEIFIKKGTSKLISKEECRKVLSRAEKAGLVLQSSNSEMPIFICCCCSDCCVALKNVKKFEKPANFYDNNYTAQVNPELCIGCEKCITRCQMEALSMVDKISTINLDRCIGCGLCVTTCTKKAIRLNPNKKKIKPPKNTYSLYFQIMYKKYGFWKFLKATISFMFTRKFNFT
jgi:NAD-dependent dihydropyrimidine dehydrogenase PreA subunit